MTREEAIEVLQASSIKQLSHTKIIVDGKFLSVKVALDMAIEALEQLTSYEQTINKLTKAISEQEPILDKIRAEIVEMRSKQNVGVLECLDIIDKYRGEA